MRRVLDTNVVVSGLLWDGAPRTLLQFARETRVDRIASAPLLAELTNIFERGKFAKKIAAATLTVDELVDRYAALVQVVRPALTARIAPDPDDDVVIGTALAATADLIGRPGVIIGSRVPRYPYRLCERGEAGNRLAP